MSYVNPDFSVRQFCQSRRGDQVGAVFDALAEFFFLKDVEGFAGEV